MNDKEGAKIQEAIHFSAVQHRREAEVERGGDEPQLLRPEIPINMPSQPKVTT